MPQRNIVKQGFFRHYIFRKDVGRKGRTWIQSKLRKVMKDDFKDMRYIFDKLGHEPTVIIDGGANIGYVTSIFLRLFPVARIFCFEPDPSPFQLLHNNYRDHGRVEVSSSALWHSQQTLSFNLSRMSGSSSLLQPNNLDVDYQAASSWRSIDVSAITLDHFLEQTDISRVGILKLDLEGAELAALTGAKAMLGQSAIDIIHTEFRFLKMADDQPLFHEIVSYLHEYDYRLFNIYSIVETKQRQGVFGNAVFISPSIRKALGEIRLYR